MKRGGGKEAIGQAHGSEFETTREEHLVIETYDDFSRPTSDVTDEHRLIVDTDGIQHTQMNQTCFFDTRHHLDVDSCFFTRAFDEVRPVLGLTHGTRCNGTHVGFV